jgi:hypothetical protein
MAEAVARRKLKLQEHHPSLPLSGFLLSSARMEWLGNILFPRDRKFERRRKTNTIVVTLVLGVLIAAGLAGALVLFYHSGGPHRM